MKIFLSYGHDSNEPLIEKIKEYLTKDAEGNLKHEAWAYIPEIKAGKDCREIITKRGLERDVAFAGLSEHPMNSTYVKYSISKKAITGYLTLSFSNLKRNTNYFIR